MSEWQDQQAEDVEGEVEGVVEGGPGAGDLGTGEPEDAMEDEDEL